MLKNMWEIENHPIFSNGGSLTTLPLDMNEQNTHSNIYDTTSF